MSEIPKVLPVDRYNKELVANVRPADHVNPEPAPSYNLVVIGAGTGGLVSAAAAAGLGAKVALVEKSLLGGDCLNVGCVPSKSVIRSSRAAADVFRARDYGIRVPDGVEVDFPAVMERMRRIRSRVSRHDSVRRFVEMGVDVFLGEASFRGTDTVEVGGAELRFRKAVIATGARAFHPPIAGLAEAGFLTNETVFTLTDRPGRLAVIGGGPIGCELAQALQRLGSQVTLIQRGDQILPREDGDVARMVAEAFRAEGVEILLHSSTKRVAVSGGEKRLHIECGGQQRTLAVDEILVGVGRVPNVDGLNLEAAGVEYDSRKGVAVDDRLRTTNRRIYAVGDICMRYKFTHAADAAARIVIRNALFSGRKRLSALTVPWCTYTDPEVAHVGLNERSAADEGVEIETFTVPFSEVDRAATDGEEAGLLKLHVRKGSDKIAGTTIVARHAGEMISEITTAMVGNVGLSTLSSIIHPYPTQAEAIRKAADAYNRTRLTALLKRFFKAWFARTR